MSQVESERKAAFGELHHARGMIATSRHLIAVEEDRIRRYLIIVRTSRIRLRALLGGDTEEICRGLRS